MNIALPVRALLCIPLAIFIYCPQHCSAQEQRLQRPPAFRSIEVSEERAITFKIHATQAESVRLTSSDLPGLPQGGLEMSKDEENVWQATTPVVPAGAYRYHFNVDGLSVIDPRNPATSEANSNTFSLVVVPGSDAFDLRDVPHGSIAQIKYFSKSLKKFRRFHVYTPPGYETGTDKLPVLYLLHGATDSDASWSTVGQAGNILDNLLDAGNAKPMIIVMPAGHTGQFSFGPGSSFENQMSEFVVDFQQDIRPLVESRFRVSTERQHRAIAGLSMGGAQTLDVGMANLADFAYLGVFSSGVFGIDRGGLESGSGAAFKSKYEAVLTDPEIKKDLRLIWVATGKDDFLLKTSQATVEALKSLDFEVTYKETEGGHTWLNWRDYLHEFAPLLFVDKP